MHRSRRATATRTPSRQPHSFTRSLESTTTRPVRRRFEQFYRLVYPDLIMVEWYDRDMDAQKAGIDAAVFLDTGRAIHVDEKIRDTERAAYDMLIEVYSDHRRQTPGWIRDPAKRTDYIAYAIPQFSECWWVPYRALARAFERDWRFWVEADRGYPHVAHNRERGREWQTWNVAVPWRVVAEAVRVPMERLVLPW